MLSSGVLIHPSFDPFDVLYAQFANVRSFRNKAPDETVADLIAAALPRTVWMCIVNGGTRLLRVQRFLYPNHVEILTAVVERDRLEYLPKSLAAQLSFKIIEHR